MLKYPEAKPIGEIITAAQKIVIIQADNPDSDSLASALALEHILGDLGKDPYLYCGVDVPSYLHYLAGWDRVSRDMPSQFDASIIVDTSSLSLLEQLNKTGAKPWVAAKPCIILDHHDTKSSIDFAKVTCQPVAVSTGEVIYELAGQLNWPLNDHAKDMIATSIMSDSLGLISDGTSARSIAIISELVEQGVSLAKLDDARRQLMRKSPELNTYKGQLLQRIEYFHDNQIATVTIPWSEIEKYSPLYNPSMLVIDDMRMTEGTDLAIAFKVYQDGHVTAKIRANYGRGVAAKLAEAFGGGGHPYASGFKTTKSTSVQQLQADCVELAHHLLTEQASDS